MVWKEIYRNAERQRVDASRLWIVRLAAGLLLGAALTYAADLALQPAAFLVAVFVMAVVTLILNKGGRLLSVAFFLFSALAEAYVMSCAMTEAANVPLPDYMRYEAVVMSQPLQKGKTLGFDALVVSLKDCEAKPFMVKMRVPNSRYGMADGRDDMPNDVDDMADGGGGTANGILDVSPGDAIYCISVFKKPHYVAGNFDYARYLATQGYRATTFVRVEDISRAATLSADIPYYYKLRIRMLRLRQRLLSAYQRNGMMGDNLAVLQALTLGDKSALSADVRTTYSVAGASHVLALSGMHLSVIFTLLMLPVARMRLIRWRIVVTAFVITLVWLYVMLVGMPLSAVRSAVMLSVLSFATASRRGNITWASLSLAAIIVVAVSPLSILDVGFQMSFIAVASILLFVPVINGILFRRPLWQRGVWRWTGQMASVSIAAQLGVSPLTAYYFGRFSCYFLLTNFIAVPLAALLLYGGVAMLLLHGFPLLQRLVGCALDSVLTLLGDALQFIASLPLSSIENLRVSSVQVILLYVLILAVYLLFSRIARYRHLILVPW